MPGQLEGKAVLIVGAGGGIGKAIVGVFAREGARLVVSDYDERAGEEAARLAGEFGGEVVCVRADITRAAEVKGVVRRTVEAFGRLDALVNSAGAEGPAAPTADYPEEAWDRVVAVNLKGAWLTTRYAIPEMARNGGGSIVHVASVAAMVVFPWDCAYNASKAGVVMLTRTAATEYARYGIRVNAVCPGVVETPMLQRIFDSSRDPKRERERWLRMPVMGRFGRPEEIAEAALFLASDASGYVTGHALVADGGWTLR